MLNKEPCPLKIDPYRGVLITRPILNSTANKYIIRMDFYILDIIDQKIRNFITCRCRNVMTLGMLHVHFHACSFLTVL